MPTFEYGDIVRVPFPYTDRDVQQKRPALVVSSNALGHEGRISWLLMITSAHHRPWPGDLPLGDRHDEAGLPAPSMIRTSKIASVDTAALEPLGRLPDDLLGAVQDELRRALGLT